VRRTIRAGVGTIEPHLAAAGRLWAIHAHLVVDTNQRDPDFSDAADVWDEITVGRGLLLIRDKGSHLESLRGSVEYNRKAAQHSEATDWCPRPGALPLWALKELFRVTRGMQTGVKWNAPRSDRRRRRS
jgi:hypothetical protein